MAFTPTGSLFTNGAGNDGLFFTPTENITLTKLGYYNGGFLQSHAVTLFDATTRQALSTATVSATSVLESGFRYENVAPVQLEMGRQYAVVGFHPRSARGEKAILASNVGANASIRFDGYFYNFDTSLTFTTIAYDTPIFGANFQFTSTPVPMGSVMAPSGGVPEPSAALTLLVPGALTTAARRRR